MRRTPRPTLVLLAPYEAALWAGLRDAIDSVADTLVIEPFDDSNLAAMAKRVLEAAPRQFYIAGICLGGYLAFEIHRRAPNRILGMALLNTSAAPDSEGQAGMRRERIRKLRLKLRQTPFPDAEYVVHAAAWLLGPRALGSAGMIADTQALLAATPITRSLAQQEAMLSRPDSRPDLGSIGVPTMVIGGCSDRICSAAASLEIAQGVRSSELHIMNCGHLSPIEEPEHTGALITSWLGAHTANQPNS